MNEYTIKTATAEYTGGGIYIFYGKLDDGKWFRSCTDWDATFICMSDTSVDDADYDEFYEEHLLYALHDDEHKEFFNDMINWIKNNKPKGNYNMTELERLVTPIKPQPTTSDKIKELERELRRLKRVEQLETFLNHMSNTFNDLMGDDCTNETCTDFYNMPFTISFNGKSIRLDNGAETFQEIESTIQRELDEITE